MKHITIHHLSNRVCATIENDSAYTFQNNSKGHFFNVFMKDQFWPNLGFRSLSRSLKWMFRLQELILGIPKLMKREQHRAAAALFTNQDGWMCYTGFVNKWASGWVRLSEWVSERVGEWVAAAALLHQAPGSTGGPNLSTFLRKDLNSSAESTHFRNSVRM